MEHRCRRLAPGTILGALALAGMMAAAGGCKESSDGVDASTDDVTEGQSYHYVLIEDLENPPSAGGRAGADMDGVELINGSGSCYASTVHESGFGAGDDGDAQDTNQALGAPEGTCDAAPATWVSLGGDGGYLVVSFTGLAEIRTGDTLRIHSCDAVGGTYDAMVGVSNTPSDPNWVQVITDATGTASATVPTLPIVPLP